MYPIFHILELTPDSARLWGFAVAFVLSAYIVFDGYKTHGRERLALTLMQAGAFFAVAFGVAYVFITPDRLPEAFGIPLRMYGLMVVIGMVSCFFIQRHFGRRLGLTGDQILTIWVYGGISAIVGARGLHVFVNWSEYAAQPMAAFQFWDGGLAFIGAALASLLFSLIFLRRIGAPLLPSLDALTLGVALTHGFGRLGCFFAGCCYGRASDLPWAVSFPVGSIAQYTMVQLGTLAEGLPTPHLHPTQLYEAAVTFAIGGALLLWYRRGAKPGMIVTGYLAAYPCMRFLLELVRDDPEREFLVRIPEEAPRLLSTTQTVALLVVPAALMLMWRFRRAATS